MLHCLSMSLKDRRQAYFKSYFFIYKHYFVLDFRAWLELEMKLCPVIEIKYVLSSVFSPKLGSSI